MESSKKHTPPLARGNLDLRVLFLVVLLLLIPTPNLSKAQQSEQIISGRVIDSSKKPVPGVAVRIKGQKRAKITNQKGEFSIPIKGANTVLVFSFIGMQTVEKSVKTMPKSGLWTITMNYSQTDLDEVVIVNTGYQNFDRRHLTSAVTTLKADEIKVPGLNTIDQLLEGRVPGMIFMQNSGQVGAAPKLRIRGTSTLLGNQEPLWVLDGIILTDPVNISPEQINDLDFVNLLGNAISGINPDDIDQIDVLKDAAATAVYGPKAANGVIVITTKKGKVGSPTVSYSFSSGIRLRAQYTSRGVNVMNSQERIDYSREIIEKGIPYIRMSAWAGYEGALKDYYSGNIDFNEFSRRAAHYETNNTDWFDIIFRNAISHSHTVSVSGGTDKIRYYTSLGYNNEKGTLRGESTNRYTGNMNLNMSFGKLDLQFGTTANIQKRTYAPSTIGLAGYAYNTSRAIPALEEDGSLSFYERKRFDYLYPFNIINERDNSSDGSDGNQINAYARFDFRPTTHWRLSWLNSINLSNTNRQQWWGEKSWYVGTLGRIDPKTEKVAAGYEGYSKLPAGGELMEEQQKNESYSSRLELNYSTYLGEENEHSLSASAFAELSSSKYIGMSHTMRAYMKDRGLLISPIPEKRYPEYDKWRLLQQDALGRRIYTINNRMAGIFTFMYSYKNRYILNANMRFDASNKFGNESNNKILPIWSLSGRWNIKDDLLKNVKLIDYMALRGSFGYQGNMLDDQSPELIIKKGGIHPFYNELTSTVKSFPNPNLKWEKTASLNAGIDFSIWKGRISGRFSGYYRKTTNAYMTKIISPVNGVRQYVVNSGEIENSGVEAAFSLQPFNNMNYSAGGKISGISWRIDPQIGSVFNQLINKLNVKKRTLEEKDQNRLAFTDYLNGSIPIQGRPINGFYSYKFRGLDPQDGRPTFYDIDQENREKYGKMMKEELYQTVMEYSGSRQPFLQGGIGSTLQWKRLIVSFNIVYSIGAKIRLLPIYPNIKDNEGTMAIQPEMNMRKELTQRWRRPGDETHTDIPGILPNEKFKETLSPWFNKVSKAFPYPFASNIWQMYDNSNIRVASNDYIKLQSISLRYVVPEDFLKKLGFKSGYVSFSGSNLFTIASKALKGQEPTQSGSAKSITSPIPPMYNISFNISF